MSTSGGGAEHGGEEPSGSSPTSDGAPSAGCVATLDDRVRATIESGSSHLAALVMADGSPLPMRGWGAAVHGSEPVLRVLLDAADVDRIVSGGSELVGSWIAYTTASVRTLTSFQLKGRISVVEPATDPDRQTYATYVDEYFTAVLEADFIRREMMERMEPDDLIAIEFAVEELFDQSPGPGAGRVYGTTS